MERLSMRKIREVLRQKWKLNQTHREVADSLRVSLGVVSGVLDRAQGAGLDWDAVCKLSDTELEVRLYGPPRVVGGQRPMPDPVYIHLERKKAGVTLELLHLEYLEQHPDGYRYTQFCDVYRRWLATRGLTMRQVHRAGEKAFLDYSGKKPRIVDPKTGEVTEVELFVAVLGASNYTYAEATRTQQLHDWVQSNVRALSFFGGVTAVLVPDQLKSAVTISNRYEPQVQRTYEELGLHYDAVIIPARPYKARDKAKVEVGVQIAQRWILARLRNQTFFSLEELNGRIAELLVDLNERRMRLYGASRRELFERLDKPALKPLPSQPFEYAEWKQVRPNIDYHVEYDFHFYSVPHALTQDREHKKFEVRATALSLSVLCNGEQVAFHVRSYKRGCHTTIAEHMPKSHREHRDWSPSRFISWASTVGPKARELVEAILAERPHPEQGYRSCLGILRLAKRYGNERLEAACARAVEVRARSYRHVESILKNGLDRVSLTAGDAPAARSGSHENVRGRDYYN
jgi:transposase